MSYIKPQIFGHDSARQPVAGNGWVVGNGASDPEAGQFGGFVKSAVRLVTAGAVPFLRITTDTLNFDRAAIVPVVRGGTFAHAQIASLTATVGGTPDTIREFDVVYFDATGAAIEPLDGARLDLLLYGDRATR